MAVWVSRMRFLLSYDLLCSHVSQRLMKGGPILYSVLIAQTKQGGGKLVMVHYIVFSSVWFKELEISVCFACLALVYFWKSGDQTYHRTQSLPVVTIHSNFMHYYIIILILPCLIAFQTKVQRNLI